MRNLAIMVLFFTVLDNTEALVKDTLSEVLLLGTFTLFLLNLILKSYRKYKKKQAKKAQA